MSLLKDFILILHDLVNEIALLRKGIVESNQEIRKLTIEIVKLQEIK